MAIDLFLQVGSSADVLEALGINLDLDAAKLGQGF